MKLTNTYTRVAVSSKEVHQEPEDDELDTEDLDRTGGKQRWTEGSPYAICNSTLSDDVTDEKFDRCVEDVQRKHKKS